ncbi:MAG TPA: hypothetical protein VK994_05655 [Bacteroidales bacterium]|nr:hypothetical protein [Bacteroidales bacterium]
MKICIQLARWAGLLFGKAAIILVLLGIIAFLMWVFNDAILFNVANYWNYLIASIPFSLLSICCVLFVIMAKKE